MKKVLLLMVAALMISSVAMADHLGVYADMAGESCTLGAVGGHFGDIFVLHKYSQGTLGSRFKVTLPPGSAHFGFNTTHVTLGVPGTDLSVAYPVCHSDGTPLLVGSLLCNIAAPGEVKIETADLQQCIQYANCLSEESCATGGSGWVGMTGECNDPGPPVATRPSTWGQVKSLYR